MRKFGLLCVVLLFAACKTDKLTDLPNRSQFYYVRVDPQAVTLAQGGTQQLTVTAYDASCTGRSCNPLAPGNPLSVPGTPTFRSTDTTVAKVSTSGVVTAQGKAGTANIIGALQDIPGVSNGPSVTRADTTPVTVLAAGATPPSVNAITISATRNTNGVGSTLPLTITYTDASGATVATQTPTAAAGLGRPAFFTSDPSVATVSATGNVIGVEPGTATISAVNTVGGTTKATTFAVTVTPPVTGTFTVSPATSGTGTIFFPQTLTVSATEAVVEGRPNTTTPGAVVTFTVAGGTFSSTTTPNDTQCFNVTFANPSAAQASSATGNTGNIGTGAAGSSNQPLCSSSNAQSRLFTTPGTYTFTSTTNGATGTLIVQ